MSKGNRIMSIATSSLAPGIHYDIPFADYQAMLGLNISRLEWADCSAEHLKAALDCLSRQSMDSGSALRHHVKLVCSQASERVIGVATQPSTDTTGNGCVVHTARASSRSTMC